MLFGSFMISSGVPSATMSPTMLTCAGAKINQPIGGAHCFFVVLDHEQGIAQVAHPLQRLDQAGIVALVQSYRWLIQHVQHTR